MSYLFDNGIQLPLKGNDREIAGHCAGLIALALSLSVWQVHSSVFPLTEQ